MFVVSLAKNLPEVPKLFKGIPPEDFAHASGDSFAVCDGVTLLHYHPYPNPSPAARAARIAAKALVAALRTKKFDGVRTMKRAFVKANDAVRHYNRRLGLTPRTVDFLTKQYAATVCAYGRIRDGKLYWGQLNDCGIMIVDAGGRIVADLFPDRGPVEVYVKFLRRRYGFATLTPEEHQYFRREIVNNARLFFRGKKIRWGVMTGEPRATAFVRTGMVRLRPGWQVVFYSDGMIPLLELPVFRALIGRRASPKQLISFMKKKERDGRPFQSERTMIIASAGGG